MTPIEEIIIDILAAIAAIVLPCLAGYGIYRWMKRRSDKIKRLEKEKTQKRLL